MWFLQWQAGNHFRSSMEYFLLRCLDDDVDLLHFNFAAGIYRQARSRSSPKEYSPIFLSWKSCKITRVSFILLFEDRIVYSYPPEGQVTVVIDGSRPLRGKPSLRGIVVYVFNESVGFVNIRHHLVSTLFTF